MNKFFNKNEFIKTNNELLYQSLMDFLKLEINEENFTIIYNFLSLDNFRSGEYEGNQYLLRKESVENSLIINLVDEEFKNDFSQTRFNIRNSELIFLMDEMSYKTKHSKIKAGTPKTP